MERQSLEFHVITQNIDGTHERIGNRNVIELYGNMWRMGCERDGTMITLDEPVKETPPLCQCGSIMRPDVVWFGEQLPQDALDAATLAASESKSCSWLAHPRSSTRPPRIRRSRKNREVW